MSLLSAVSATLRRHGVPHAAIGAIAMAARGVSRATLDADLLVTDPSVLDADVWEGLAGKGPSVDVRPGDADDPLAGVIRIESGDEAVDVIVGRYRWQQEVIDRADALPLGDVVLKVARTADLVLLKLYAGGPQDAWDIHQLLQLPDEPGLRPEVESRLPDLPAECRLLWLRLAGEARR